MIFCNPKQRSCTLEFDGASKGNPGQAGAGAILRSDDGGLVSVMLCREVVFFPLVEHVSLIYFTC